jgi:hypothetical protein
MLKISKIQKIHPLSVWLYFTMVFRRISVDMKEQALNLLKDGWNIEVVIEGPVQSGFFPKYGVTMTMTSHC